MARYLVVAHKTVGSPELQRTMRELARCDDDAEFDLLVPASPRHPLVSDVRDDAAIAQATAMAAAAQFQAVGLRVSSARAGDANVVDAIRDQLREQPRYECIVIATLPPRLSHWLRIDALSRAQRLYAGRLIHVVAHPVPAPAGRPVSVAGAR